MTIGFSTTNVLNRILNSLRGTAWTPPTGIYARLHTGDPGAVGTANAAAGDTTRKAVTFAAASGGSIATNGTAPQWTNGGTSETLTHVSFWDDPTAGNFLFSDDLALSKLWGAGDTYSIPNGSTVSFGPAAA
jgi:hypothetical protein